jgi:hypothetical protein
MGMGTQRVFAVAVGQWAPSPCSAGRAEAEQDRRTARPDGE